eukprot:TRINITY_DN9820_c0_g1_i4.p1 TRINITY_DN9820_c0_g1~~TRINITY_DN9820_c0_g1_i4.p1  ORF type:complete len:472 (+),score=108.87 TRINITY_DN9820_c0_g1_i4:80-1495(+)
MCIRDRYGKSVCRRRSDPASSAEHGRLLCSQEPMTSATTLHPLSEEARYCVAIKLTEDVLRAVETGQAQMTFKMGKQNILSLGQNEYQLFVTPEDNHVAYRGQSNGLQEIGSVLRKAVIRPRAGDVQAQHEPEKRRAKGAAPRDSKTKSATVKSSLKRKSPEKGATAAKRPRAATKAPAKPSSSIDKGLTIFGKRQRVMHLLAMKNYTVKALKTHSLLKKIPEEELGRLVRAVADLQQGGKFEIRKAYYRQLDPEYPLLTEDERELLKINILTKGQIQLSECVPNKEEPAVVRRPVAKATEAKPKAATSKALSPPPPEISPQQAKQEELRRVAAASQQRDVETMNKKLGAKLSEEESRVAELGALKQQLGKESVIKTLTEAELKKAVYHEKYPQYLKLNQTIERNAAEFQKLKKDYSTAKDNKQKASVGNKIDTLYTTMHAELKRDLHKYNILHVELAHIKAQLRAWGESQ